MVFKFFQYVFNFFNFNEHKRKENGQNNIDICRDTIGDRPSGPSLFLMDYSFLRSHIWWHVSNSLNGSPLFFVHFPKCLHYFVDSSQGLHTTVYG